MTQSKARSKLWNGINGATGVQVLTAGGTLGTGNIAYGANIPAAGDTIGVLGVTFTFYANGAAPSTPEAIELDASPSVANSLAAAEPVIEAHPLIGTGTGGISNVDVTNINADLTFRFNPAVQAATITSDTTSVTVTDFSAGDVAPTLNTSKSAVYLEWADAGSTLGIIQVPDGTVDGQSFEIFSVSEATVGDTIELYGNFAGSKDRVTIAGAAGDGGTFYWDAGNAAWKLTKATNTAIDATLQAAQAL